MNTLLRWAKFNLVGAMGMVVQLAALALFNRCLPGHYMLTSAAALELTLLHNFIWHLHFTWRDRSDGAPRLRQFVRFQFSNGLISLAGNLALMRLLVHGAHPPVLASNLVAILCCSLANFWIGNNWAFAGKHKAQSAVTRSQPVPSVALAVALLFLCSAVAGGQTQTAPAPPDPYSRGFGTDCAYANIFAGPAVAAKDNVSFTGGVTIGQYFARTLGTGINASPQFELGVVGPLQGGHPIDGLASMDAMFAGKVPHRRLYPFLNVGYSRMFATGNAANFGLGFDFGKHEYKRIVRIELRDYYLFTGPRQHVVGLRIGFGKFIDD